MSWEQSKKRKYRAVVIELLETEETILLDIVFNNPGIYLDEIKSTFEGLTGKSVHIATLCREVTRLGLLDRAFVALFCSVLKLKEPLLGSKLK